MKKSYYCKKLGTSLNFLPDEIKFCCACAEGPGYKIKNFDNILDKNEILKTQEHFKNMLENGIVPKECTGCIEYKEKAPESFFKKLFSKKQKTSYSYIVVNHFKQCDCNCIYCAQKIIWKDVQKKYQLLPIINALYNADLIDKQNLLVEFQGGNVSCLDEFDDLINVFTSQNCNNFKILTNGIKYLDSFDELCNKSTVLFGISLDSGTKETFYKIKNVDKFENVIETIKRIMNTTRAKVCLKYIIIQDVNDNIEEIKKFADLVADLKLDYFDVEIDYRNTLHFVERGEFIVPEHYYKILEQAKEYCRSIGVNFCINDFSKKVLEDGKA